MPLFLRDITTMIKVDRLWGFAFVLTLILPWMLVFSRTGMEICTGLIGLSFLYHSFRTKDWRWFRAPFMLVCFAAWLWLVLVVTPLGVDPKASLSNAGVWFRMPLLFAALNYWVLKDAQARQMMILWFAAMMGFVILDALWQFATGVSLTGHPILWTGRLTGPFDSPKVGIFLSKLLLPVSAILFVYGPKKHHFGQIAAVALVLLTLSTIILSGERSAFVTAMLGGAVGLMLIMVSEKRFRLPCLAIGMVAILLVGVLFVTTPKVQLRAGEMLDTMLHYPQSDYGLLAYAGVDIGLKSPIHGVGIKGFRVLCPWLPYVNGPFRGLHPHNAYIEWFAEAGFVGLGLFITMLVLLVRRAWHGFRALSGVERLVPAAALGMIAQHFFPLIGSQSFFVNWSGTLLWLSLGLMFAAVTRPAKLQ